jgi:hypothetical protein
MEDPVIPRTNPIPAQVIPLLLNAGNLWLIGKLIVLGMPYLAGSQESGFSILTELGGLEEFRYYRNLFYLMYIAVFMIAGLSIMFRSGSSHNTKGSPSLLAHTITAMIITTFSFAIAGLILDAIRTIAFFLTMF